MRAPLPLRKYEPTKDEQTLEPESKPKRKYKQRLSKSDAEKAITQLEVTHKYVKKDILTALKSKECYPGTNARLAYLKALQQLEIDYVEQIPRKWGCYQKHNQSNHDRVQVQGTRGQRRIGPRPCPGKQQTASRSGAS